MPKDNEVDEKVRPVAWQWLDTSNFRKSIPSAAIREHWNPLYSAATVAELRAEVERLREANQLYSFAMNTAGIDELKRRADAAERRVGELEALLTNIKELTSMWRGFAVPSDSSCMNAHDCADDLDAAIAGADPT